MVNVPLAASAMGLNGEVKTSVIASNNNSAGVKTLRGKFGGSDFLSAAVTTTLSVETEGTVVNRGLLASQLVVADGTYGATSGTAPTQLAVNTGVATTIAVTGQVAVATDYLVVEAVRVTLQA